VPWDQALEIIMQSKGLDKRKNGNVIFVAPSEELAAKEKAELTAQHEKEGLESIRTESFTLKYLKAADFKTILNGGVSLAGGGGGGGQQMRNRVLSERGTVNHDSRTNTLFVQDTAKKLEEIQAMISRVDVPIKQVMIESRLVIADDKYSKDLGARLGITQTGRPGRTVATMGGSLGNRPTTVTATGITQGQQNGTIQTALTDTIFYSPSTNTNSMLTSANGAPDLMSNLAVANSMGSFAYSIYNVAAGLLLNLELSAMEKDERGKIVSSPRVITANQNKAKIAQGTEIPYQAATSSGATNVQFKSAALSLEVTPQITPDEKIIMELDIKKDRVGAIFSGVPSIDTQNITTQVLVGNGETAVLGGIFEMAERNDVDKVPFFGDLPLLGHFFKRTMRQSDKTELLIFITPRIVDERLTLQ
jgi:type IV pilus assembly protein PilQ